MSKGRRPRPRGWRQRKYEKPPRGTMAPSTYGSLSRCHMGSPSPWPRVSKQSGQASQSALHRCRALPALAKYPTRRVRPMPNAPAPHRWRRAQANGAIHRICPARPRSGRQCANGPQGPAQAPLRSSIEPQIQRAKYFLKTQKGPQMQYVQKQISLPM